LGAVLVSKFSERKSGIPPMTGYVRLHSLHWRTFSVEWSGRLHLGQAKLIGLINVVSDNEISPLLKMTGVPPNDLRIDVAEREEV
jgi:hypothetical protein